MGKDCDLGFPSDVVSPPSAVTDVGGSSLSNDLDKMDQACVHMKEHRAEEKEFQSCLLKAKRLEAVWKEHVSLKFPCLWNDNTVRSRAVRAGVHEVVDMLSSLVGGYAPAAVKDCVEEFTSQCRMGTKEMSFLSRVIRLRGICLDVESKAAESCADEALHIAFVEEGKFTDFTHEEVLWKDVCDLPGAMYENFTVIKRLMGLVDGSMVLLQDSVVQDLCLQKLKLSAQISVEATPNHSQSKHPGLS